MRALSSSLVVVVAFAAACGGDEPPARPAAVEGAAPIAVEPEATPVAAAAEADEGAAAAPEAIPEEEVRGLLDTWLAAQNGGDFEAYSALYAERFQGVKRSGERVRTFDREGWLDDRRRMFARPMQVEAADVRVQATSSSAIVDFEQRWASATYRDVGPKRLLVVRSERGLGIAREEMLASRVESRGSGHEPPPLGAFFFVVEAGGPNVVLSTEADEGWSEGRVHLAARGDVITVARRAVRGALSAELAALSGQEVRLFGASGEVCSGTLGALRVLRRVRPHFGTVQTWNGEDGSPRATAQQIADEAWMLGDGGLLAATLDGGGACDGALFAQLASRAQAAVYALAEASPEESGALVAAVRGTRSYRELAREQGGSGPWEMGEGGATTVLTASAGGRRIGAVELRAGSACGDMAHLFVPLDFAGARWVARDDGAGGGYRPLAAFDLDADGAVEYLVEDDLDALVLLRAGAGGAYRPVTSARVTYLDCPC